MNNSFVIDTGEGCESFALVTPDLIVRGWLDGQDPDVLGGHIQTVSYKGGRALESRGQGDDAADFAFYGSRADLVALAYAYDCDYILSDQRFEFPRPATVNAEIVGGFLQKLAADEVGMELKPWEAVFVVDLVTRAQTAARNT